MGVQDSPWWYTEIFKIKCLSRIIDVYIECLGSRKILYMFTGKGGENST